MKQFQPALIIAKKEIEIFFLSPIAYVLLFAFSLVIGIITFMSIYDAREATFVIQSVMYSTFIILMFISPFFTMRLISEEKRSGTIEILFSIPLSEVDITMGKFLGALAFYGMMISLPFIYALFLLFFGKPDLGILFTNILGIILSGSAFISIGLLCSALTKNQIVSAMLCFAVLLFLLLVDWVAGLSDGFLRNILMNISITGHFSNFSKGLIDSADVIYLLSFVTFNLFLVSRILSDRRSL